MPLPPGCTTTGSPRYGSVFRRFAISLPRLSMTLRTPSTGVLADGAGLSVVAHAHTRAAATNAGTRPFFVMAPSRSERYHRAARTLHPAARMKPAQIEALAGTTLLVLSALKRGSFSLLAFLGAAALITHATMQRAKEGFR